MPQASITDWIMVIITTVYVIATIAICIANYDSVKATNMGVEESKRQFEEARRLQVMPYIQVRITPVELEKYSSYPKEPYFEFEIMSSRKAGFERTFGKASTFQRVSLVNIGLGTLHHATIKWNSISEKDDTYSYKNQDFSLAINSPMDVIGMFSAPITESEHSYERCSMTFSYKDLLGNTYSQELKLWFSISDRSVQLNSHHLSSPSVLYLHSTDG